MLALLPKTVWLYPISQAWLLEALGPAHFVYRALSARRSSWPHTQPVKQSSGVPSTHPIPVLGPEPFLPHPSGRPHWLFLPHDHMWAVCRVLSTRVGLEPGKCQPYISEGDFSTPSSLSCLEKEPKEGLSGSSGCQERRGCSQLSSTMFSKLWGPGRCEAAPPHCWQGLLLVRCIEKPKSAT